MSRSPFASIILTLLATTLAHAGTIEECKVDAMNPGHEDLQPANLVISDNGGKLSAILSIFNTKKDEQGNLVTTPASTVKDAVEKADLTDQFAAIFAKGLQFDFPGATIEGYGLLTTNAETAKLTKYDALVLSATDASGKSLGSTLFIGFGSGKCK